MVPNVRHCLPGRFCTTANRTSRTWKPNVFQKKFRSDVLDRTMKINVTTHTMRCIDKAGGFDAYIMNTKASGDSACPLVEAQQAQPLVARP